ncbi:MAG: choice-of-anchor J domain-containing protein, partial [Cytophagaceae bacterium]|nr:choice-of-anchor J domain-containing protein [Cytophagaceae bacterium]
MKRFLLPMMALFLFAYMGYAQQTVPYSMGFEDTEAHDTWLVEDVNGDWSSWGRQTAAPDYAHSGDANMYCQPPFYGSGNDWLFSPKITLEAGKSYKVKFWTMSGNNSPMQSCKMSFSIATDQSAASVIGDPLWVNETLAGSTFVEVEVYVTGYAGGHYSFGFRNFSDAYTGTSYLDDFSIEEVTQPSTLTVPYFMGFENNEAHNAWTIENVNGDNTWARQTDGAYSHTGAAYMQCLYNNNGSADDWLFSPKIALEADKSYKVRFWTSTYSSYQSGKMSLSLATGQNVEDVNGDPLWVNENVVSNSYSEIEVSISGKAAGEYSFAFHAFTDQFQGVIYFDDFSIEEIAPADAAASKLFGTSTPMAGKPFTYKASVVNAGVEDLSAYIVKLVDADDNILATAAGTNLAAGATAMLNMTWTPTSAGNMNIRAVVEADGDGNASNNTTAAFAITVQATSGSFNGRIGMGTTSNINVPFNFTWSTSMVQTIYFDHELIGQQGAITGVQYFNNFTTESVVERPVKIWMANTERADVGTTWVPESEFTLVFDGIANFPLGQDTITITLDEPYLYTGQNLAIMTDRPLDNAGYGYNDQFYRTQDNDFANRSRYYVNHDNVFSWTQPGIAHGYIPNTVVQMNLESGIVTGTVIDGLDNPVEGALVEAVGTPFKAVTDAEGNYAINFILPGEYSFKASKVGYSDDVVEETAIVVNETSTLNFVLQSTATYTVSGKVTAGNAPNGVANVDITLSGYANFSATTDAEGNYAIEDVFGGYIYDINAEKIVYELYESTVTVAGDVTHNISLVEKNYPVVNPLAEITDNNAVITWDAPIAANDVAYILDNDGAEEGFHAPENDDFWLGNKFEVGEDGVLTSIDVFGSKLPEVSERTATIDIFDVNHQLIGSSQPFIIPGGEESQEGAWLNVPLNDIPYSGVFYAMVHWANAPGQTNWLEFDTDGPHTLEQLSMAYDGNMWHTFYDVSQGWNGVFMVRANASV